MIEKMTPEQLKAVFDMSDISDVTKADYAAAYEKTGSYVNFHVIRLLKHYHPELFVDPRLEAAKKLAREILAEEYEKIGEISVAHHLREGSSDDIAQMRAVTRALLADIRVWDGDDA